MKQKMILTVCSDQSGLVVTQTVSSPQRLRLPALRTPHSRRVNGRIFRQQCLDVAGERVLRVNGVQPVGNTAKVRIEALGTDRNIVCPCQAIEYRGQMTIDTLCTVRAVAITDTMNVSDVLVFPIDYLYNDQTETAYLRKAGELEKAFEWCGGTNGVTQLRVEGTLSNKDVEVLKGMTALKHLK